MNIKAAPKYTMRRPTLPGLGEGWNNPGIRTTSELDCFAGVVDDSMSAKNNVQHGKPHEERSDRLQLLTREGKNRPHGVSERFIVLKKPGNSGGGKEP